jgi:hypothetical protein
LVLGGLRKWFKDKERAMHKYFVVLMSVVLLVVCGCDKKMVQMRAERNACDTAVQCDDGNVCTADTCVSGACQHNPIVGCAVCTSDAQCDDGNLCTSDRCVNEKCMHTGITGCALCRADADCSDTNPCTVDSCVASNCSYRVVFGCTP